MLYVAGIAITFFLAFILFSKKHKSTADTTLAIWLCCTAVHLLLYYLFISAQYISFPFLLGFDIPMPLLHGPFLFLYTAALTQQKKWCSYRWAHFIPFLAVLLLLYPFIMLPTSSKIAVYQAGGKGYELLTGIVFVGAIISGVTYTLLSLYLLARHRNNIRQQFSSTHKINLQWLFYLISGSAIIWLAVIFLPDAFTFSAIAVYVFFIGYFGVKQVGIFTNTAVQMPELPIAIAAMENDIELPVEISDTLPFEVTPEEPVKAPEKIKYEKSKITAAEIAAIHEKLTLLMQKEKLYKNPELTLNDIAQQLPVHPNTLSQVINTVEQKNFYDYINGLRVQEFTTIALLPANQQFTLLSLAFECGFNSKTAFNRNFKKATQLSPTEYLAQKNVRLM